MIVTTLSLKGQSKVFWNHESTISFWSYQDIGSWWLVSLHN